MNRRGWSLTRAHLDQLQRIAAGHPSRTRFLTDLTLDPPETTSQVGAPLLDEDYLILSTIHSAKGQEWKSVFVLNVVDGSIPSEKSTGNADDIEEERRLLYAAMTRAKDELSLIVPYRFHLHGQSHSDNHVYALRSRFIPASIVGEFDECNWLPLAQGGHSARRIGGVAVDLTGRMRGRWRKSGT